MLNAGSLDKKPVRMLPRHSRYYPVEIIPEAGYYMPDLQQDTRFLLTLFSNLKELGLLTNRTVHLRVRTIEFTRQPGRAALVSVLAAHGDELRALALPTPTTAVMAGCCSRLESLRTEHPYATLPAPHVHRQCTEQEVIALLDHIHDTNSYSTLFLSVGSLAP
ncbi:hypothetical protein BJV78DRAFT_1351896 [Lactifluus subvellereus]|nr:hypothetical protein BJV78DRAFT_1351896 [Lactifluus subvellereus]